MRKKLAERFWMKVRKTETCWRWTSTVFGNGYGAFYQAGRVRPAHRVAYELSIGPIPDGKLICHHCDNPLCVNPTHLYAGTQKENMADMDRRGRRRNACRIGLLNTQSKLTEENVIEIRRLGGEMSQREIGKRFGCTQQHVSDILLGRRWGHLK